MSWAYTRIKLKCDFGKCPEQLETDVPGPGGEIRGWYWSFILPGKTAYCPQHAKLLAMKRGVSSLAEKDIAEAARLEALAKSARAGREANEQSGPQD